MEEGKTAEAVQDNTQTATQENPTVLSSVSQTPEVKAETKPIDGEKKTEQAKADDYAFELPKEIQFDKGILDEFTNEVKNLKVSKEAGQKFLDIAVKNFKNQQAQHIKTRESWVNEIKTDKDFGGDKFNETITRAQRVLSDPEIGSPQFVQLLESTGLGDHPEVIKILARIDKKYGEDRAVTGKPSGTTYKSAAELFYPSK